ncbi:MAG: cytochrome c3 family protein [Enhygromyxa sp.]
MAERRGWLAVGGCLLVAGALSLVWRPALSMPDAVRIPIVEPRPDGARPDAALFRHGRHDQFSCAACHPGLFPKWRAGFTHRDMNEGRFCGACHDGTAGFDLREADCKSCHVPK